MIWGSTLWVKKVKGSQGSTYVLWCVPGGPRFLCCSQLILIAPLSLSHRGLKGTTLANSLQGYSSGWHPESFWTCFQLASLPLPIRSPPHSVLGSGIQNGPARRDVDSPCCPGSCSYLWLQAPITSLSDRPLGAQTRGASPGTRKMNGFLLCTLSVVTFITMSFLI